RPNSDRKINAVQVSPSFAKPVLAENFDTLTKMAKANQMIGKQWSVEKKMKSEMSFEKARTVTNASNVIGVIEGTDKKDEYVFLTGHYDHLGKHDGKIYYGAD